MSESVEQPLAYYRNNLVSLIGGRLIIPVGPTRSHQELLKIVRTRARYEQSTLDEVVFVPLQSGII